MDSQAVAGQEKRLRVGRDKASCIQEVACHSEGTTGFPTEGEHAGFRVEHK